MPRDSGGNASVDPNYKGVGGQTILTTQHNTPIEQIVQMLTDSLSRSGLGGMLAALNMGTYRVTNMGDGVNPQDAATIAQIASASPVGIITDFAGPTPPVGWLFCFGQAISRADYAALFAVIGTTYGPGDGITSFNLPDCRDRTRIGKGNMGGTAADRITNAVAGFNTSTLGAAGGAQSHTLTSAQMPVHNHTGSGNTGAETGHTHAFSGTTSQNGQHAHDIPTRSSPGSATSNILGVSTGAQAGSTTAPNGIHDHTFSGNTGAGTGHTHPFSLTTSNAGSGQAHPNVQPSITFNTIIKAV